MKVSDMRKLKIGDKIAVSLEADACWYEIVKKGRLLLDIQESENHSIQTIDICQIMKHKKQA